MTDLPDNAYKHILNSLFNSRPFTNMGEFNQFLKDIGKMVESYNPIIIKVSNNTSNENNIHEYVHKIYFINGRVTKPTSSSVSKTSLKDEEAIFPNMCRLLKLSYSGNLIIDIKHQIFSSNGKEEEKLLREKVTNDLIICEIPMLVGSDGCRTIGLDDRSKEMIGEDPDDIGGYYISKGSEKVILMSDVKGENNVYIREMKETAKKFHYEATMTCSNPKMSPTPVSHKLQIDNKNVIQIQIKNSTEDHLIPVTIMFKAFGIITHKEMKELMFHQTPYISKEMIIEIDNILLTTFTYPIYMKGGYREKNLVHINTAEEAILYMSSLIYPSMDKMEEEFRIKHFYNEQIHKRIFPHLGSNVKEKVFLMGHICNTLINARLGRIKEHDRDDKGNKRIITAGRRIRDLIINALHQRITDMRQRIPELTNTAMRKLEDMDNFITSAFDKPSKYNVINKALSSGHFPLGPRGSLITGISIALERKTYLELFATVRKITTTQKNLKSDQNLRIHMLHGSQYGYICSLETPESSHVGLDIHLAQTAYVSARSDPEIVYDFIDKMGDIIHPVSRVNDMSILGKYTKIIVNGRFGWLTPEPEKVFALLKSAKRSGKIHIETSVIYYIREELNEIVVYTDSGRLIRPLLIVDEGNKLRITPKHIELLKKNELTWYELMTSANGNGEGVVEYISIQECEENCLLAKFYSDLKDNIQNFSHCEIHPSTQFGLTAGILPFLDKNQQTRNTFACAQLKGAISIPVSNHKSRMDSNILIKTYLERPLTTTFVARFTKTDKYPIGINAVVAYTTYNDNGIEDAIVVSKSAIFNGFMGIQHHKVMYDELKSTNESFALPPKDKTKDYRNHMDYSKLNENGTPKIGSMLTENDIAIGKIQSLNRNEELEMSHYKYVDKSKDYKSLNIQSPGLVYYVLEPTTSDDSIREFTQIKFVVEQALEVGDKLTSRSGNKGIVSICVEPDDMIFTSQGITPSLIVNPHSFPSRMAVGQLHEGIASKAAAIKGITIDGTPFTDYSMEESEEDLKKLLQNIHGLEQTYDPVTGAKVMNMITVTPNHYERLKHIVSDKYFARSRGVCEHATRQPKRARADGRALKIGEMEQAAHLGHGAVFCLKQKFMEDSDRYKAFVCDLCGLICVGNTENAIFKCLGCKNTKFISEVEIPYTSKTMIQQVMSMNVLPRLITDL